MIPWPCHQYQQGALCNAIVRIVASLKGSVVYQGPQNYGSYLGVREYFPGG